MKFSIANRISLLRLASFRKILLCEIFPECMEISYFRNNESFFKVGSKKISPRKIKFIAGRTIEGLDSGKMIAAGIKEFCKEHSLKNIPLIVGVSEYRSNTCAIPSDTEDIDLWFEDNAFKFIPEGRSKEEFLISYEQYKSDDEYHHFIVVIIRKDYLENILCNLPFNDVIPFCILPFLHTVSSLAHEKSNTLFIKFSHSKAAYSFCTDESSLFAGEIYHNLQINDSPDNLNEKTRKIIFDLRSELTTHIGSLNLEELEVYVSCEQDIYPDLGRHISEYFKTVNVNKGFEHILPEYITGIFALNKMTTTFNTTLNLLTSDKCNKFRERIERKAALNVLTLLGGLVFILLAVLNIFRFSTMRNEDIGYAGDYEKNVKQYQFSMMELENKKMKNKILLISDIKKNRRIYADLLYEISENLPQHSRFTEITIKENKDRSISIVFTGEAFSQKDVAIIVSGLELSNKFRNVSLISSGSNESYQYDDHFVHFKIKSDYHAIQ